ncbi:MAG: hypothetical protein CMC13_06705 [Flavobacteriaceae bacterium]|nr:hypothetical protein [Flavobacteriaceae bacterium]|tara:strand:+ start:4378 stop:5304 length:927 start_codon:yes stop_codon:yes gene_type:complete
MSVSLIFVGCADDKEKKEPVAFKALVNNWNKAHSDKDLEIFSKIYSDSVLYYGSVLNKNACLKDKLRLFEKYPDFNQHVDGDIKIDSSNLYYKVSFIKKVSFNQQTKNYPSYLEFKMVNGEWKIITESDLVTDKNLAKKRKFKTNSKAIDSEQRVRGDYDGDGKYEYVNLIPPEFPKNSSEEYAMTCIGECTSYLKFSNENLDSIELEQCIGGMPINEGDLNGDGTDEIGILPQWWTSCWSSYRVFTYKNNRWNNLVDPISTHCNSWTENFKPIEKDKQRPGNVIIRKTIWTEENTIGILTTSIPLNE